jgi:hypothetical protein
MQSIGIFFCLEVLRFLKKTFILFSKKVPSFVPNQMVRRGINHKLFVPDIRRWIVPEVVLVRCWVIGVLGIWRGRVWGKGWDRGGQFTSNLRPRWTDPVTARRVPSK